MLRFESAVLIQSIQNKEPIQRTVIGKNVLNMTPKGVSSAVTLSKVKRNKTTIAKALRHVKQHNRPIYK